MSDIDYLTWNTAIADTIYTEEYAGVPVYMDLDEDSLSRIADAAGCPVASVEEELTSAVCETISLTRGQKKVFDWHAEGLRRWRARVRTRESAMEPPPVLPLLAVTVLAAEAMGSGDEAAHAYFPHLSRLLGASDEAETKSIESSYRVVAESFWEGVNEWLSRLDGQRGLPSAFALSHRYVGLPMSQALIRTADRDRLPRMFASFGLPPGYSLAPSDMAGLFDQWMKQQPCPVSNGLSALWQKSAARERIAEVVANELINWDGQLPEDGQDSDVPIARGLVVMSSLRRRLGKVSLESTLGLKSRSPTTQSCTLQQADGEVADLQFVPRVGGILRLDYRQPIDMASLLSGEVTIESRDGSSFTRRPRQIVPLSFDDVQSAYVETERVQLGQESLLLVRSDEKLLDRVEKYLTHVCRPGFEMHSRDLPGLPGGWVLFSGVEVLGQEPTLSHDLNELVPLASVHLAPVGGLKLPGQIQKWSSLWPPDIQAISQRSESIRVLIRRRGAEDDAPTIDEMVFESSTGALLVELRSLDLNDGDYRVSMYEGKSKNPLQQMELRLRSSSTPDVWTWLKADRLWHDIGRHGPLAVVTASAVVDEGMTCGVDGPHSIGTSPEPKLSGGSMTIRWRHKSSEGQSPNRQVCVAEPNPRSCVVTGAHFLELPTSYGPRAQGPRFIEGVCKYCGLVRRLPAWAPRKRALKSGGNSPAPTIDVTSLPVRSEEHREVPWTAAMDALMHLGGGKYTWLERIAMQMQGSTLFVHRFAKDLSALGHIDVKRDAYGSPTEWELAPRYIVQHGVGTWSLVGHWPNDVVEEFDNLLQSNAITLRVSQGEDIFPTRYFEGSVSALQLESLANAIEGTLVQDAAHHMLAALPSLSQLMTAMPRVPSPGGRKIQTFDVGSTAWIPAHTSNLPGAYRVDGGSGWTYLFRTQEDVEASEAVLGSAYLVKHLAALQQGLPLVAYLEQENLLVVPIGADLPGLYERAACLASGSLPQLTKVRMQGESFNVLGYAGVSHDQARYIVSLLAS